MNRRQFLTLGLILPFVPQIKTVPQFENDGLVFPMVFSESESEYKPTGTNQVQITNFKSESLITKIWRVLSQSIK